MPRIPRLLVALALAVFACLAAPAAAEWTIVAADPSTGEVGVAGASCESVTLLGLAALAPGKGAAAAQGEYSEQARDRIWKLLGQGAGPVEIIATVTGPAFDKDSASRQYGIATTANGGRAGLFTGSENEPWAGGVHDDQTGGATVAVQGSDLVSEEVVRRALEAFGTDANGPLALTDRLMRALEAASAAGGDRRCNDAHVTQTARSTFIVAARGADPPFAAPFGRTPKQVAGQPWLSLSVSNADNRENPVLALREEYDLWREANLAPCGECDLSPIPVPAGDEAATPPMDSSAILGIVVVSAAGLVIVAVVSALAVAIVRRRRAGAAVAASPPQGSPEETAPEAASAAPTEADLPG